MTPAELNNLRKNPTVSEFPRLSRFYGIPPSELAELPRWMLELYITSITKLQTEEQLLQIQAGSFPHMEDDARKKLHRQLLRYADLGDADDGPDVGELDGQGAHNLSAIGIAVKLESTGAKEVGVDA
jgi:hypothetical protein